MDESLNLLKSLFPEVPGVKVKFLLAHHPLGADPSKIDRLVEILFEKGIDDVLRELNFATHTKPKPKTPSRPSSPAPSDSPPARPPPSDNPFSVSFVPSAKPEEPVDTPMKPPSSSSSSSSSFVPDLSSSSSSSSSSSHSLAVPSMLRSSLQLPYPEMEVLIKETREVVSALAPRTNLSSRRISEIIQRALRSIKDEVKGMRTMMEREEYPQELQDSAFLLQNQLFRAVGAGSTTFVSDEADIFAAQQIQDFLKDRRPTSLEDILCVMRNTDRSTTFQIAERIAGGLDIEQMKKQEMSLYSDLMEVKLECELCFDVLSVAEMYTLNCPLSHRFCFDCIRRMIELNLKEGGVPVCPIIRPKPCGHHLSEIEIHQLFNADDCKRPDLVAKYNENQLKIGLSSLSGLVGCPSPDCNNFVVVDSPSGNRVKIHCDQCHFEFCSKCKSRYHYGISCDQRVLVELRWEDWKINGAQQYDELITVEAREKRKRDFQKRIEDFKKDERWKETHLRLCPGCSRPIEKVSGCDSMVCGRNYHGGDAQDGCGLNFDWNNAKPYKAVIDLSVFEGINLETIDDDDIKGAKKSHADYLACDSCHSKITGLRFQCINCPSFYLCENCQNHGFYHEPKHAMAIFTIDADNVERFF